jgi:D-tyrosyl-tRNA(Tyr) deacylase
MRLLIQRVTNASIEIEGKVHSSIGEGLLVFAGIEEMDDTSDVEWLAHKLVNLRVFDDENKIPNHSVKEKNGEILVVSQFTLHALTKKGNRPSYIKAGKPVFAEPLYEQFILQVEDVFGKKIATGKFGADMKVSLLNDGPVTIWIDSKNKA